MEISQEIIEKHGLSEEAVVAIQTIYKSEIGEILPRKELEYDLKYKEKYSTAANDNAENIIGGAGESLVNAFGLDIKRENGEKAKEFYLRINDSFKSKLDDLKNNGLGESSPEFLALQEKYDTELKKSAKVDELEGFKEKYDNLLIGNKKLTEDSAFNKSMPKFSKEINQFESEAKSKRVKEDILSKFNIENEDGVWVAVDKENPHKKKNLKTLIEDYDDIKSIVGERKQKGLGISGEGNVKLDGIPFEIQKGAPMTEVYKKINAHLEAKGLKPYQDEFSVQFSELSEKIKKELSTKK